MSGTANDILPYCVADEQIPADGNYRMQGFCSGVIYVLAAVMNAPAMNDAKRICIPAGVTVDQTEHVIVPYISARPARMHEPFIVLASEAIGDAWRCKPPPG